MTAALPGPLRPFGRIKVERQRRVEPGPPTLLSNRVSDLPNACSAACNEGINQQIRIGLCCPFLKAGRLRSRTCRKFRLPNKGMGGAALFCIRNRFLPGVLNGSGGKAGAYYGVSGWALGKALNDTPRYQAPREPGREVNSIFRLVSRRHMQGFPNPKRQVTHTDSSA